jgi:aminopeptidase N
MALLYLEEAGSGGASRSRAAQILADLGSRLQAESRPGETFDGLGPVWLGQRLATASDPEGYHETVYAKATWIVHMLRMLMREEGSSGDDRFFSMVREFLGEFGGRAATTWDLKAVAENHLGDRMDLEGDGTLDWFFDQWVFGTGIPDYAIDYDVAAEPTGGFRVEGRVTDRLGLDFTMPLPLYARTRAGEVRFLGDVVVSGNSSDFGFVLDALPIEILLDPERSVLRR